MKEEITQFQFEITALNAIAANQFFRMNNEGYYKDVAAKNSDNRTGGLSFWKDGYTWEQLANKDRYEEWFGKRTIDLLNKTTSYTDSEGKSTGYYHSKAFFKSYASNTGGDNLESNIETNDAGDKFFERIVYDNAELRT